MGQAVLHRPRVAWESARVIVAAIEAGYQGWLAYEIGRRIDPDYYDSLLHSWQRIASDPALAMAEAGLWRVRLEDLLNHRPETTEALMAIVAETDSLLGGWRPSPRT